MVMVMTRSLSKKKNPPPNLNQLENTHTEVEPNAQTEVTDKGQEGNEDNAPTSNDPSSTALRPTTTTQDLNQLENPHNEEKPNVQLEVNDKGQEGYDDNAPTSNDQSSTALIISTTNQNLNQLENPHKEEEPDAQPEGNDNGQGVHDEKVPTSNDPSPGKWINNGQESVSKSRTRSGVRKSETGRYDAIAASLKAGVSVQEFSMKLGRNAAMKQLEQIWKKKPILIFPFEGDVGAMEKAAEGLGFISANPRKIPESVDDSSDAAMTKTTGGPPDPKSYSMTKSTITMLIMEELDEPNSWWNGDYINFWMSW